MERRIDDQRPSAPLEWEAKHAAMDRAGELPLERRVAERRKEPPALVTVMAETVAKLKEQLEHADKEHCNTIDLRDEYYDWADKLAEAIAKHFDTEIGEYSSTNCPWSEALEVIESHPVYATARFSALEDAAQAVIERAAPSDEIFVSTATDAIRALASQPPEQDNATKADEIRELLGEAYRFNSTSPRAQSNINAALELLDEITQSAPPVQQPGDVREAWEYSFTHSSALGKGETDIGPCLTYDRSVAYGAGCFNQRQVVIGQALATTRPSAALKDEQIMELAEPFGAFEYGDAQGYKRIAFARSVIAASSGALAVPEGLIGDLQLVRRVTGTVRADSTEGYYEAIERVFNFAESMISAAPAIPAQGQTK